MNRRVVMTRVEGAGEVLLEVEAGRFASARVAMLDTRRGFEQLVRGRHYSEVPALVSRVCAICSASHRVVAARALEQALQIEVPPAAARLRQLLLYGALIESHALHLFLLVEPDLRGCDSIAELLGIEPERISAGLELRQLGRQIQEVAGGRAMHPPNVEVGGIVAWPAAKELAELHRQLRHWGQRWAELEPAFLASDSYTPSACLPVQELTVVEDKLVIGSELVPVTDYVGIWSESMPGYTRAGHYRRPGSPLLCGALARLRQAGDCRDDKLGAFANCAAQAREIGAALNAACAWFEKGAEGGEVCAAAANRASSGVAALEAPRGLLLHAYELVEDGTVQAATIVTPTAINQLAMEAQLCADLQGAPDDAELSRQAARIVRAFDPCISCAVHVLKK